MPFVDLPHDVHLKLAEWLPLTSLFSLLATCTTLRELSTYRGLWIHALAQTRKTLPLPLPFAEDLEGLELAALEGAARRVVRRERNWGGGTTPSCGPVRCLTIGGQASIIAVVPATGLVLVVVYERSGIAGGGRLVCVDTQAGEVVGAPRWCGEGVLCSSVPYEERGRFSIAVVTAEMGVVRGFETVQFFLTVLCIEYGAGGPRTMRQRFKRLLRSPPRGVFLYRDLVGLALAKGNGETFFTVFNFYTWVQTKITTAMPLAHPLSTLACYPFEGNVYAATECRGTVYIYRLPQEALPYGDSDPPQEQGTVFERRFSSNTLDEQEQLAFAGAVPAYGVHAVSVRHRCEPRHKVTTSVRFWPADPTASTEEGDGGLTFGAQGLGTVGRVPAEVVSTFSLDAGATHFEELVRVGASGTCVVGVVGDEQEVWLQIVRWVAGEGVREVELGWPEGMNAPVSVGVDEYAGVVYVSTVDGELVSIPFCMVVLIL